MFICWKQAHKIETYMRQTKKQTQTKRAREIELLILVVKANPPTSSSKYSWQLICRQRVAGHEARQTK